MEGVSGRNNRHWNDGYWGGLFFFKILNPPHFGELQNFIGGGFCGVYMNSSNLLYVVIIFLKVY